MLVSFEGRLSGSLAVTILSVTANKGQSGGPAEPLSGRRSLDSGVAGCRAAWATGC